MIPPPPPFPFPCRWVLSKTRTDKDLALAEEVAALLRRACKGKKRKVMVDDHSYGLGAVITMLKVRKIFVETSLPSSGLPPGHRSWWHGAPALPVYAMSRKIWLVGHGKQATSLPRALYGINYRVDNSQVRNKKAEERIKRNRGKKGKLEEEESNHISELLELTGVSNVNTALHLQVAAMRTTERDRLANILTTAVEKSEKDQGEHVELARSLRDDKAAANKLVAELAFGELDGFHAGPYRWLFEKEDLLRVWEYKSFTAPLWEFGFMAGLANKASKAFPDTQAEQRALLMQASASMDSQGLAELDIGNDNHSIDLSKRWARLGKAIGTAVGSFKAQDSFKGIGSPGSSFKGTAGSPGSKAIASFSRMLKMQRTAKPAPEPEYLLPSNGASSSVAGDGQATFTPQGSTQQEAELTVEDLS